MLLKKTPKEEESGRTSPDRYLITYADLITLLLGLFVILYVSARVDEERYKEFAKAFADYFKPQKGQEDIHGTGLEPFKGVRKGIPEPVLPFPDRRNLKEIETDIVKSLEPYIRKGEIFVENKGQNIVVTLPEKLLFKSGKAEIEPGGEEILGKLAQTLVGLSKDQEVAVDGHTDSDPISNFRYPSNWHLSVARSVNVAYLLISKGVPEYSIVVRGFADQRPISDNASPEGKAKNRRVEITISEQKHNVPNTKGYEANENGKK
ncbi:MAG: OmpA family protein [Ignavibacteria bacterium]|nr:OmpA family protein [Ignavibacteria bacterium]